MIDVFKPVQYFADYVVYKLLGLHSGANIADSLNFFIYDTIKICILLLCISFFIGFLNTFFTPEKTKNFLAQKHKGLGNVLAALLGIVTPFCSCSACPLFIGFVEAGIPLGITFSFLIAAPMINEVAMVLLWGFFGAKITIIYVLSGLVIAIAGGFILGLLKLEKFIEPFIMEVKPVSCCSKSHEITLKGRILSAKNNSLSIFKKTWIFIVIGVALGALVHGYVPTAFLVKYAGAGNIFAVPLAVIMGVPLYASCAGMLPLSPVLIESGLPVGTVLAFTMAVTAISFPEIMILRRVMKWPLLAIFVSIVTIGIIFTGYLFNFLF